MRPSNHAEKAEQVRSAAPEEGGSAPSQEYFLERLQRLTALREQQLNMKPQDKFTLRLLARALYATYMDCVAVGAGDQAGAILEKEQSKVR